MMTEQGMIRTESRLYWLHVDTDRLRGKRLLKCRPGATIAGDAQTGEGALA